MAYIAYRIARIIGWYRKESKESKVAKLIEDLPKELLMEIVLFLQAPSSDILNFMLVCKSFNAVMKENCNFNVWEIFCYRYFPQQDIKYFLKGKNESSPNFWKIFKDNCVLGSRVVFCGSSHTIFLIKNKDGEKRLFGCGSNWHGQLGFGNKKEITKPCQLELKDFPEDSKIVNVFCGYSCTIFLIELKNGERKLFGCGDNKFGQLGLGDKEVIAKPCQLKDFPKDSKIVNVFCGTNYTIFLIELKNGERKLFGCGNNEYGQLGLGYEKKITKPCQLKDFPEDIKEIINVACGGFHTIFLIELENGERQLFGCGDNRFGQLGLGDTNNRVKPYQLKGFPEDSKIINVFCSYSYTIFLIELENGERQLFGCGDNEYGQLGLGGKKYITKPCQLKLKDFPEHSKIINVFCGGYHTIFLIELENGKRRLFSCGNNEYGQLGLGNKEKITKPCRLEFKDFPKDNKIVKVVCGSRHTIFLIELKNGKRQLFGCGNNEYGQLGLGGKKYITKPCQLENLQDRNDNGFNSENYKKCCIQ